MSYAAYREVQCDRDIAGDAFSRGQQHWSWRYEGSLAFNPYRSYFKVRVALSLGDGTALQNKDGIGLNMFFMDNLFQKMTVKGPKGRMISTLDDYVPQCSALKRRLHNSRSSLKVLGEKMNMSQPILRDRIQVTATDGIERWSTSCGGSGQQAASAVHGIPPPWLNYGVHTIEFLAANTIQFAGAGLPDLTKVLHVGQRIWFDDTAGGGGEKVTTILSITANSVVSDTVAVSAGGGANAIVNQFRIEKVVFTPEFSRKSKNIEICWKPEALGFFSIDDWLRGHYVLTMTPYSLTEMQRRAVEAYRVVNPGLLATDFKFEIVSMLFHPYVGHNMVSESGTKKYQYSEIRCRQQTLTTHSLTEKQFVVDANTYALSLAFQDSDAGQNVCYSASKFKIRNDEELNLSRFHIRMRSLQLPDPPGDPSFTRDSIDYIAQNYYEGLMYSGAKETHDATESLHEWKNRGIFMHYNFPLVAMDLACGVNVATQFSQAFSNDPQVCLFNHYFKVLQIRCERGYVVDSKMIQADAEMH